MNADVKSESIQIPVQGEIAVAGTVTTPEWWPSGRRLGVLIAHDAHTSAEHPQLVALTEGLARRGHLGLRFNFPFTQAGKKRPDPLPVLERSYHAAAGALLRDPENAPARLIVAGIGLGARVACQIVARGFKVDGLISLSYPLHPSGKPNQTRAEALSRIICPMLFVQGDRDPHCRLDRMEMTLRRVGAPTTLRVIRDASSGLEIIRRTDRTPEALVAETQASIDEFIARVIGA